MAQVPRPPQENQFCSSCGSRLSGTPTFCSTCGQPVTVASSATSVVGSPNIPLQSAPTAYAPPPAVYLNPPKTANGFAVASLVLGLLWLSGVGSILAVVFGRVADRQIRESSGRQSGWEMASWGIVLGIVGMGADLIFIVSVVHAAHPSW